MCTQRPCRCSVKMFPVEDHEFWEKDGKPRVGAYRIVDVHDQGNRYRELYVVLPCEGGELHGLPLSPAVISHWNKEQWQLSGTPEAPTLLPSVRTGQRDNALPGSPIIVEYWHGWVLAGELKSC